MAKKFKPGNMWSDDFDYDGMLEYGKKIDGKTSDKQLEKYADSMEDVNYHTLAKPLFDYQVATSGDKEKIKKYFLTNFKRQLSDELQSQGEERLSFDDIYKYKKGGKVDKELVFDISDRIYFTVIEELGIENEMIDETDEGTQNTAKGRALFDAIEESVESEMKNNKYGLGGYLMSAGIGAYLGAKNPSSVRKVTDPLDKAVSDIGKNFTGKKDYAKGGLIDNTIHPYLLQQKVGKQLKTIKGLTEDEDRKITDKMLEENNQQVSVNINYGIDKDPNYFAKGGDVFDRSSLDNYAIQITNANNGLQEYYNKNNGTSGNIYEATTFNTKQLARKFLLENKYFLESQIRSIGNDEIYQGSQLDVEIVKIKEFAKGGNTEAEWLVILEGEDGFEIDEIVFAKSEDEAYNKAEKLNPNSYSRGINMLTDYDGSKVEYAKGGKIEVGDVMANTKTKTIGIVRDVDLLGGDVRTDADGVVDADNLEHYSKSKHKEYQIAPSTKKEIGSKFAKGGKIEERVYAIDMRANMYQDEGFFTYNQFKRYADELSDDEFMDEAETQGLVWSSMDGYIMSNEYNDQGAVDNLVERQIPVKMMVAKEYVNPDFLAKGGTIEITSAPEYHKVRNKEYDKRVKEGKMKDTDENFEKFDDEYFNELVKKGEIDMDNYFAKGGEVKKKENNEMIMGGLAGILLGIFLNK